MAGRLLRLSWRNLWRNRGRTLITMAAIAFGYAMLLFVSCLMAGLRWQMVENGTGLLMTQIQVHAPGYYPDRSIRTTLGGKTGTDVDAMLAIITADRRIHAAAPRVYGYGMVSAGPRSAGVELLGIVPDQEERLTTLNARIAKGSSLTARAPKGVVMGDKLAGTIGVDVGSEVALLVQTADGSMGTDTYTLVGTVHTGLDALDQAIVLMPLSSLQELLHLSPARIHEVGIRLNDVSEATATAAALEVQLGAAMPVRVRAWPELAPELASYLHFNSGVTFILFVIFFFLAVLGVMNTMLMAVFERIRELGMLMALGMRPGQVMTLLLMETACLAVVSLAVGAAMGVPILWYLEVHGLDVGDAAGEAASVAGVVVGHVWYGRQDFPAYGQAALGLAATSLVAALYPGWRAARLRPTEAIHKV